MINGVTTTSLKTTNTLPSTESNPKLTGLDYFTQNKDFRLTSDTVNFSDKSVNSKLVNDENLNDVGLFYKRSDDKWEKTYQKNGDFVHMKVKGMKDGQEYELYSNGKVQQVGTWQQPKVIMEENEQVARYVENLKNSGNTPQQKNLEPDQQKHKTSLKEKFGSVWKFFSQMNQMTYSTIKGLTYGIITGTSVLAGSWVFNTLPKVFEKDGLKFGQILKHPLKNISKSGKIMAGIVAVSVLAYQLIVGKMQANQKTAVIDHKLDIGHRDK